MRIKNHKKILLLLIFISFLIGSFCFAQGRELEIEYPGVPGVETPTTVKTALPEYLQYVFTFAIIIAGLLAFGSLIYGGIRYLTSAGDPTKMSDAKNQVIAGFSGLIILLSSYLILNTINPQLVLPKKPPLQPAVAGVYAYVKADCIDEPEDSYDDRILINEDTPDLSERLPKDEDGGSQSLQCIEFRSGKEELTVKVCPSTDFGGMCTPYEGDPGNTENVTGKSIKLDYHPPGVYLYASDNCNGDDYKVYQSGSATLPEFDNKTNSIKFIYGDKDPDTGEYKVKYAAILHEKENYMGDSILADQSPEEKPCIKLKDLEELNDRSGKGENLTGRVSSITVYLKPEGEAIGQGVRFWGDKNWTNEKDEFVLPSEDGYYGDGDYDKNLDNKTGGSPIDVDDANDKITSMEMDGHYVALLFGDENYKGDCEVFMSSDPDFRNNRIGQCGFMGRSDCLSSFIIKARK